MNWDKVKGPILLPLQLPLELDSWDCLNHISDFATLTSVYIIKIILVCLQPHIKYLPHGFNKTSYLTYQLWTPWWIIYFLNSPVKNILLISVKKYPGSFSHIYSTNAYPFSLCPIHSNLVETFSNHDKVYNFSNESNNPRNFPFFFQFMPCLLERKDYITYVFHYHPYSTHLLNLSTWKLCFPLLLFYELWRSTQCSLQRWIMNFPLWTLGQTLGLSFIF